MSLAVDLRSSGFGAGFTVSERVLFFAPLIARGVVADNLVGNEPPTINTN